MVWLAVIGKLNLLAHYAVEDLDNVIGCLALLSLSAFHIIIALYIVHIYSEIILCGQIMLIS